VYTHANAEFLSNVLYYFMEEAARRIQQWLSDLAQLALAIMMGLVPIATLPALLRSPADPMGQDANVLSLKMYKEDDPLFVQNVEVSDEVELPCGVQLVAPYGYGATRLGVWTRPPVPYQPPWREPGMVVCIGPAF